MTKPKLTAHERRAVAVRAGCDPRSVAAFLNDKPTRSTTAARIAEALRSLGFEVAPSAPKTSRPSAAD